MAARLRSFFAHIVSREQDFRIRLFHVLALAGIAISLATLLLNLFTSMWTGVLISGLLVVISTCLLLFIYRTGRYQLGYGITITVVFLLLFPLLFFTSGGYHSGAPCVFVFAVLFTVLMLEGKKALLVSLLEVAEYTGVCLFAYYHPEYVTNYKSEWEILTDIIFASAAVSIVTGLTLYLHLREYTLQRKRLQEQNEKLQQYDASRSAFLTTVSHEIKNPLNAINLYARDTAELMEEAPLDLALMRENQETIEKMVIRIDRILVDLKDTVAIEQGRLSLSLTPVRLDKLLREVSEQYFGRNFTAGNTLVLDLDGSLPPIHADSARLAQVISNLLSNALQHTKAGTITVSLAGQDEDQLVSVTDTGEGMPEEIRDRALEGYVSTSQDYWRHGIGLYICHQIIQAHGGRIWIESKPGEGTQVSFSLPAGEV